MTSAGALTDKPLLFSDPGNPGFAQLRLDFEALNSIDDDCILAGGSPRDCAIWNPLASQFEISFDATVLDLSQGGPNPNEVRFGLLLDAPDVRRLDFNGDGSIAVAGGATSLFLPVEIGAFEFSSLLAVTISVDLQSDEWSTTVKWNRVLSGLLWWGPQPL